MGNLYSNADFSIASVSLILPSVLREQADMKKHIIISSELQGRNIIYHVELTFHYTLHPNPSAMQTV